MAKISTTWLAVICITLGVIIAPTVTYILTQAGITVPGATVQKYTCPYCRMDFATQPTLNYHIEHTHGALPPSPTDVAVNKPIKWCVIDDYAGGGIATVYLYVYDTQLRKFEGDGSNYTTASDGTLTSGLAYKSDTQLKVYAVKSNSKAWYDVTVPRMSSQDAQSATSNPITLRFFTVISSPSLTLLHQGVSISDGGNYNKTTYTDTRSFTFSIFNSNDNTGYKESHDPLNDINWYTIVYLKQFDTGYETISLTGWDGSTEKGSAMYYWKRVTAEGANGITRYKVGQTYTWIGAWSFSFEADFTGYTGSSTDWDIMIYMYSDPVYWQAKTSYGPNALQLGSTFDVDIFT